MKKIVLSTLMCALFSCLFFVRVQAKELEQKDVKLVNEICRQINEIRRQNGKKLLSVDDRLTEAAMTRAEEASIRWSHTRPNDKQWYTVDREVMGGENLAFNTDIEEIVSEWMDSPAHKDNILYDDFTTTGIGVYFAGDTIYVAQEFEY